MKLTKAILVRDRLFLIVLLVVIGGMFLVLPSVSMGSLENGTQSGKTIIFLYLMTGAGSILTIRLILLFNTRLIKLSLPDLAIFGWGLYVILNSLLKVAPLSLRLVEFYGLIILYISIRQINRSYFSCLFLTLILGGAIQAFYGNLQLWGWYPSHHHLFKMTGSFFNPGPYAGYLASVFPVALGFYLFRINVFSSIKTSINMPEGLRRIKFVLLLSFFTRKIKSFLSGRRQEECPVKQQYQNGFFIILLILIVLVLPASRSRAAWLAVVFSTAWLLQNQFHVVDWLRKRFYSRLKRVGVLLLGLIFVGASLSGLYYIKKGSADGRILVWSLTLDLIRDHPVNGVGFDQFKAHYLDYQADYFKNNPGSDKAMVAGDSNYAFNELLQQTAENGIVGLVLILIILIVIFTSPVRRTVEGEKSDQSLGISARDKDLSLIAKSGIISIFVFSLFSYPAQILPIKITLDFYLAVIAGLAPQKTVVMPGISKNKKNRQFFGFFCRLVLALILLFVTIGGFRFFARFYHAYQHWKNAFQLCQIGAYKTCLDDYEKAYLVLYANGDFLTNYGKALSMAGEHSKAIEVLQQATNRYPNTVVYTLLGDNYKKLGEINKAEQAYLHAWYMNPSRFYPKYLLAKLYDESGQNEKAVITAKELLKKQVKIESTTIEEIRVEMEEILLKHQSSYLKEGSNTMSHPDFKLQKW